jgi:succinyl-CoA synthetase (ADP-forming) beta subunit (EC 6.2.1.5)
LHACRSTLEDPLAEQGGGVVVVKAQIHAGGRGKAGGVKVVKSADEAFDVAQKMLGMKLVTHQTGPAGKEVRRLLIEQGVNIEKEFYLGITLDRAVSQNVLMVSTEGGVEIEAVAEHSPEKIFKQHLHPLLGVQPYQARQAAFFLGLEGEQFKNAVQFILALCHAYQQIGYRARIRNHGHSCFLCEIVIRSQFHTTYEPEA